MRDAGPHETIEYWYILSVCPRLPGGEHGLGTFTHLPIGLIYGEMHVVDGVPKMVQIYKDRNPLDALATRTSMKVVRALFGATPRAMTSSQLAEGLETSRSSIQRALARLEGLGLVRSEVRGRLVLHGIRSNSTLVGPLFEMFNHERYTSVRPQIREALERVMDGVDTSDLSCVVLFGSQAKGTARKASDIDMCFVWGDGAWDEDFQPLVRKLASPYILVERHCYSMADFQTVPDLIVLDSILFGISLHGHSFLRSARHDLVSIQKEVLLARLEGCRRILDEATHVIRETRDHLETIVEVGLTEVESVLHHGVTIPRAEIKAEGNHEARLARLSQELALEGVRVSLT